MTNGKERVRVPVPNRPERNGSTVTGKEPTSHTAYGRLLLFTQIPNRPEQELTTIIGVKTLKSATWQFAPHPSGQGFSASSLSLEGGGLFLGTVGSQSRVTIEALFAAIVMSRPRNSTQPELLQAGHNLSIDVG